MDTSQLRTRMFLFATLTAAAFSFLACSPQRSNLKEPPPAKSGGSSQNGATFGEVRKLVFDPKCLACHTSGTTNLSSRTTLLAGTSVVPGRPEASALYRRVADGSMPQGGPALDPDQVSLIYEWIEGGAVDDEDAGPNMPPPAPPASPESLIATALSSTEVELVWVDKSDNETGFKIERSDQPDTGFVQVALIGQNAEQFYDGALVPGATYYYQVRAIGERGESAPSNVASAMISP